MTKILFLDFETTITRPFDATKAEIIEVGAALFEDGSLLEHVSFLVRPDNYKHDPMSTELCGITETMVENANIVTAGAILMVNHLIMKADFIAAHNGTQFDKIVYENECARTKMRKTDKTWIDTMLDIPYPAKIETRKLTHIAADLGIINPFAHRAGLDVLTMAAVFYKFPTDEIIRNALSPVIKLKALVKTPWTDNGIEKEVDKAKKRGFKFDANEKIWFKNIKEVNLEKETKDLGFAYEIIK